MKNLKIVFLLILNAGYLGNSIFSYENQEILLDKMKKMINQMSIEEVKTGWYKNRSEIQKKKISKEEADELKKFFIRFNEILIKKDIGNFKKYLAEEIKIAIHSLINGEYEYLKYDRKKVIESIYYKELIYKILFDDERKTNLKGNYPYLLFKLFNNEKKIVFKITKALTEERYYYGLHLGYEDRFNWCSFGFVRKGEKIILIELNAQGESSYLSKYK